MSDRIVSDAIGLLDIVIVLGAGFASHEIYLVNLMGEPLSDRGQYALGEALAALFFALLCHQQQAYRLNHVTDLSFQLRVVSRNLLLAFAMLAAACFLTKISASFSRSWAVIWMGLAALSLTLGRVVLSRCVMRLIDRGYLRRRRAIIGEEMAVAALLKALREAKDQAAEFIYFLSHEPDPNLAKTEATGCDGEEYLLAALRALSVNEIIVACSGTDVEPVRRLVELLKVLPADVRVSLPALSSQLPIYATTMIGALPIIDVAINPMQHYRVLLKRVFDVSVALALTILLLPFLMGVALLIKLDSRGPVFFVQQRYGFNNEVIRVIKFRTMHVDKGDASGALQTKRGDARVTRLGRILRAHSLDELPQLFNVLRGDMSLVGPRPHALAMKAGDRLYHEAIIDYFARHRVKPGITGWAQINGLRGEIMSLEMARKRIEYDLNYIDNWSLWHDIKILLVSTRAFLGEDNAF